MALNPKESLKLTDQEKETLKQYEDFIDARLREEDCGQKIICIDFRPHIPNPWDRINRAITASYAGEGWRAGIYRKRRAPHLYIRLERK